jgi:hypothetical protein
LRDMAILVAQYVGWFLVSDYKDALDEEECDAEKRQCVNSDCGCGACYWSCVTYGIRAVVSRHGSDQRLSACDLVGEGKYTREFVDTDDDDAPMFRANGLTFGLMNTGLNVRIPLGWVPENGGLSFVGGRLYSFNRREASTVLSIFDEKLTFCRAVYTTDLFDKYIVDADGVTVYALGDHPRNKKHEQGQCLFIAAISSKDTLEFRPANERCFGPMTVLLPNGSGGGVFVRSEWFGQSRLVENGFDELVKFDNCGNIRSITNLRFDIAHHKLRDVIPIGNVSWALLPSGIYQIRH